LTGWIGIGFSVLDGFFEDKNFHKLSYPGEKLSPNDIDFNGDTLYHAYGQLGFREYFGDNFLGVPNYLGGRPGESGSSLFYTDNFENFVSFGVFTYFSDFKHSRLKPWQFYAIQSIIEEATVIEPSTSIQVSVFPNPTTDIVKVAFEDFTQSYTVVLSDVSGRQLAIKNVEKGQAETNFDLTKFAAGVYFIRVTDNKQLKTIRVVKSNK
jgi:hypothetical protein